MAQAQKISDLYSARILELAALPPAPSVLSVPLESLRVAEAEAVSKLCGSKLWATLGIDENDIVRAYAQKVQACVLGQAAAAVMAREIIGIDAPALYQIAADMRAMLRENAPPPLQAQWADLRILESVRAYPHRHASTLLVFDAVSECLTKLGCTPPPPKK